MSDISEDKLKLMKTFMNYDDSQSVLGDGDEREPSESNTLLMQMLLEMACRNVEEDPTRRQDLFLRMWNKLTEAKLTDELKFHMDALFSVRNQAIAEFEKELSILNSKEVSSCRSNHVFPDKYRCEFEEVGRVGRGGFGTVWKARHKIDDICYAVKRIAFRYRKDSDFLKVIREVKSFATLNHLNVVRYNQAWLEHAFENSCADIFDKVNSEEESAMPDSYSSSSSCCQSSDGDSTVQFSGSAVPLLELYIQMEFCDFDLRFWMDERAKGGPLPFQLSPAEIFRDILKGVNHIHSKDVIHRDLKPQNIFFSVATGTVKIGDFGLATLKGDLMRKDAFNCGTPPYAAPELRNNSKKYDSKVDMYSVGVILVELLTESKTRMELSILLEQIFSGTILAQMHSKWPQYGNIVEKMLSSDPGERFPAEYVLNSLSAYKQQEGSEEVRRLKRELMEKEKRITELESLLQQQNSVTFAGSE